MADSKISALAAAASAADANELAINEAGTSKKLTVAQIKTLISAATLGLPLALTGATAATRYVGATASGAPASGTFAVGDFVITQDGSIYVCTVAGTPGTWAGSGGGGAPTSAQYVVAAADATLSAEIVIPGLAASADIRVAGANDDEFDTTDTSDPMTGWTTLGAPTAHDMNSTAKSHYYVKQAATAGTSWTGIYKANPSTPFTVIAKLADASPNANYNGAGLFIGESTPGKMSVLEGVAIADRRARIENFTNPTTYASTTGGTPVYINVPVYLKIIATSSTSVAYYISKGGHVWTLLATAYNPGFTIGSVGLCVKSEHATVGIEATFDWIRFT